MVRLVFRPYTQVWRSSCTSEPLRTSIRVSPDFVLPRYSSPSFGSQHLCSNSNLSPEDHGRSIMPLTLLTFYLHCACGFDTQILAHMLDSLVRVSRRVNWNLRFWHHIIFRAPSVIKRIQVESSAEENEIRNPERSKTMCTASVKVITSKRSLRRDFKRWYK